MTTYEITPGARKVLGEVYEIVLEAAARRRVRLEREQENAASDQVDRPGALAAVGNLPQVEGHPHSTP